MIVILTEKPSAGRNFAKALGGTRGTFNGEDFEIVSARGHLFGLLPPDRQVDEKLAEKYKAWNLNNLPWKYEDIQWKKGKLKGCSETIENIKKEVVKASEVVIATDVDPSGEGDLLAWEIISYIGWNGKTSRMYFVDESEKSIQKAFRERKIISSRKEESGDYMKAETREKWDYMSMQFTRAATLTAKEKGFKNTIRQGRLKSVMVYMVGQQLEAVKNYRKVPFYEVRFKDENGNSFFIKDNENRFDKKEAVDISQYAESDVIVDEKVMKRKAPGKLLDLAGLSSILAEKGFKAERILSTYQKMYEAQIVSYPRTEDKVITPEQFDELLPLVDRIASVVGIDKTLLKVRTPRKTHVKTGGAHGANRPGINVPKSLESLKEYGAEAPYIYETLARNYLAMLGEDYEYIQEKGHLSKYPEYKAVANIPENFGFKQIFDSEPETREEEKQHSLGKNAMPYIFEGANSRPQKPTMKWLTKQLEKYNVGTGATRTSTLAEITKTGDRWSLMEENKGALTLTDCGQVSYILLYGCKIADVKVTEHLFQAMKNVGNFKEDPESVLKHIDDLLLHDMIKFKENAEDIKKLGLSVTSEPVGYCPACRKPVIEYSKSYGCSGYKDGCKFTIWKKIAGKNITRRVAEELLARGETKKMSGFKSKTGKTFSAKLKVNEDGDGIEMIFK